MVNRKPNKKEWWLKTNVTLTDQRNRINNALYSSKRWHDIRNLVLQLYEHKCSFCSRLILKTEDIEVHHVHNISLSSDGWRLRYSLFDDNMKPNLILACDRCHSTISADEQRQQSMIPFDELFVDKTKEFEV